MQTSGLFSVRKFSLQDGRGRRSSHWLMVMFLVARYL